MPNGGSRVLHPDGDALVDIVGLAVLRGTLPRRDRLDILAWAALDRSALVAEWNRLNPDSQI